MMPAPFMVENICEGHSCFLPFLTRLSCAVSRSENEGVEGDGGIVRSLFALLSSATDIRCSNITEK